MCTNLVRWFPELESNELQLLGSSIGLRYRGRYFVVSTRHQLINLGVLEEETSSVCQLLLEANKAVTNSGFFRYGTLDDYRDDDRYDIVAFFFDEQFAVYPELRDRFFDLDGPWVLESDQLVTCFAVGCAFCDQVPDLSDKRHLHVARRNHECRYVGLRSAGIRTVQDGTGDPFDPDGMSGGAIFYIRETIGYPKIEFGGMIQRGGNFLYHYIDAQQISLFLDAAIASHYRDQ